MSTKYLLSALALGLAAMAESLMQSHDQWPDDGDRQLGLTLENTAGGQVPSVVPDAPVAQVTHTQAADTELDADGLPWDERIHAATKTKTAKNVWTRRRNTDDTVFDAVTAELRQLYPAAVAAVATPPVITAPTVTAPAVTIAIPAVAATPYSELCDWLAKNTGEGKKLSDEWVKSVFAGNNTELASLAAAPEAATAFLESFKGVLAQMGG